jgi:hypothetical protein
VHKEKKKERERERENEKKTFRISRYIIVENSLLAFVSRLLKFLDRLDFHFSFKKKSS